VAAPAFTILLPIHRPPHLLPFAVASVQAQTRQDFELFIICDGAPEATVAAAAELAAADPRIRVFAHPKGERHGEGYRHQALQQARGTYVAQIGDDDLWLPGHLAEMALLLGEVDFGNTLHLELDLEGRFFLRSGDLGNPETRIRIREALFHFFGPTVTGYRLSAYRALPVGWSAAPPDIATDLHMWRKFLALEHLRFGTRAAITSIKFAADTRKAWSPEQRVAETARWAGRIATPAGVATVTQQVLRDLNVNFYATHRAMNQLQALVATRKAERDELRDRLRALKDTRSWRWTRPFRSLAKRFQRGS
jgi:glycosyltransferase involved in cell wall biosynthesis